MQRVERGGPLSSLVAGTVAGVTPRASPRPPPPPRRLSVGAVLLGLVAEPRRPHGADLARQRRSGRDQLARRVARRTRSMAPRDLGPVEEADAADLVRDVGARQRRPRSGRAARSSAAGPRSPTRPSPSAEPRADPGDERGQLGGLGLVALDGRCRAGRPRRLEVLGPPARGEEPVRELEDLRARAVVVRQRDDPRARIPVGEPGQELAASRRRTCRSSGPRRRRRTGRAGRRATARAAAAGAGWCPGTRRR